MPLLDSNDPPAFSRFRSENKKNILFTSDHNGCVIPRKLNNLGVPDHELRRHVAYDIGIDAVAHYLSARFDAPLITSNYSRLVVDCNRRPGTEGSMPAISDKTIVVGNENIKKEARRLREEEIFYPYHFAIKNQIEKQRQAIGKKPGPVLIALHSFTPVMEAKFRPWHIGILWKEDDSLARPIIKALKGDKNLCIGDNQPYSGSDPAGYTFEEHVPKYDLRSFAVEFRQDLIEFQSGAKRWAEVFAGSLEEVLATLELN